MATRVVSDGRALDEAGTPENIRDTVYDSLLRTNLLLASCGGLTAQDEIGPEDIEAIALVLEEIRNNLEWLKTWTAAPTSARGAA
jgi:hypothetical protein